MKRPWRSASAARPTSGASTNGGVRLSKPSAQTVRGRISNPIPISNKEDDEFPMRQPGTGIASAPGEEPKEATEQPEATKADEEEEFPIRPPTVEMQPQEPEDRSIVLPKDASPEPRSTPVQPRQSDHRTNPSSTLRQSMISSDTARTKSSKGQHEKKKSGLRGALGKLFGRKKKTDSVLVSEHPVTPAPQAAQHQSDPSPLRRSLSKHDAPLRSASMPLSQYDRALRSHSVGPDDVLAVDEARNSIAAESSLLRRRPGATSTHLVGVRPTRDSDWGGLTPRPASTHGARSINQDSVKVDPGEIGRAITSDFSGLKRRSRSLSFLANVPPDEDGGQRRSTELRYWRESYEPNIMSPISSNTEDVETAPMSMDLPRMTEQAPSETPPQPFQFGDLATMNELAGMRITDAVSMDSRIGSLEARVHRLENVVTQICDAVPNFKPRVDAPTRAPPAPPDETASGYTLSIAPLKMSAYPASGREMRTSTRPSTQQSQMSKTSFGDAHTFVDSMPPRSIGQQLSSVGAKERPISTATIRGATSLPSLTKDGQKPFTIDHYTTLMALIDTERSARQALEAQVKVMGHQMAIMSKSIRKRNGRANSTASGIQTSSFDVDEDDEDELQAALARQGGPGGPGTRTAAADDDDESEEPFSTPHEEGTTLDEQLKDDEESRKASARTLSLSRLTLGAAPR